MKNTVDEIVKPEEKKPSKVKVGKQAFDKVLGKLIKTKPQQRGPRNG